MAAPSLSVLNAKEIEQIKDASMDILQHTGVKMDYASARDVLRARGAKVEGEIVFFPPRLVQEAVMSAPRGFRLYARNPAKNVSIGDGNPVFVPGYGAPFITSVDGAKRKAVYEDFVQLVRLAGASSNMDITGGVLVEPNDIPEKHRHQQMLYACLANSDKPFMGSATGAEHARDSLAMAATLFEDDGDRPSQPVMITLINSLSPLMYDARMAGALMEYAAAGQPLIIASLGMAGSTMPATLASVLSVQNAEVLAGITLAQVVREGTPVVYGSASSITEMRYGSLSIGAPEGAWIIAAAAQIAHSYGLPCRAGGSLTDSKLPDAQAASESMMNMLTAGLAGVDVILHAAGILESYVSMSLEKFVLDDEACSAVKRILRGGDVNKDTLAVGLIHDIGPGGEFLSAEHTYGHFRSEFWQSPLAERGSYDQWRLEGTRTALVRAQIRLQQILESYQAPPLPKKVEKRLRESAAR
ncbi:trimethylamine methyltransferase family protein [Acididesulfobacillus acetoxydans]|uniref:trimethylamine methyltransferase family protein n=1 Tax=Acididesulfobacillus acetoxydans TaxID=1561005 RepID=UPI001F0F8AD4|nr:trimethylamine methyltransferase family protein [Acididesulfobacillus acetoxydans]